MLTKEIKNKWIKALESGKYIQDGGNLKTSKGHCCLGVLAEVQDIPIKKSGYNILGKDKDAYSGDLGLDNDTCKKLYEANDTSVDINKKRDYSEVIPLIKKLPTID